jgi:hypothetical protein
MKLVVFFNVEMKYVMEARSRDSSVGIATAYGLDDRGVGVGVPVGSRIFTISFRTALGSTQSPIQCVPGVKQPGGEADYSPPASAEVKKI